jgi:hypothetical protein
MKLLCDKAAAQRPPGSKATRVLTISVIIAGITILILGCERAGKEPNSILPPTPETDPLAQPKSLQQVGLPVELTREAIPADNPQTPEKIALGQKLFFERRLSADGTISCSTCHDAKLAFTDRRVTSVGIKGRVGQRNSPTRHSSGTVGQRRSRGRQGSQLLIPVRWDKRTWMRLWHRSGV